ncbi:MULTISPECIES: cyclopropane-fatty-acyl-phospholipid synthase family protein [Protofrankia]|uniref:SAM-dependent methyltransferase n=1 Tax=Protofrankia TaxID=2994361 RepID=UPI0009F90675|nr:MULTISPECIES: class I SAM-dependent methyltransferase [Protofrankia]
MTNAPCVRNEYERTLKSHWDAKTSDDINLRLGAEDDLYHHHYAIGDFDRGVLDAPRQRREELILRELHRMENDQVDLVIRALGELPRGARVLDAGSGRGGTAFMIAQRLSTQVVGINFCEHHIAFAEQIARRRGWDDRVRFRYGNMVRTGFPDASFDAVVSNETTMYAGADELLREFARLLRPGGRYVMATWCRNDTVDPRSAASRHIDQHYVCQMHRRSTYFRALSDNGLAPVHVERYTGKAMPYWELRSHSQLRTGVEEAFLDGYRNETLNYLVVAAERAAADGSDTDAGARRPFRVEEQRTW